MVGKTSSITSDSGLSSSQPSLSSGYSEAKTSFSQPLFTSPDHNSKLSQDEESPEKTPMPARRPYDPSKRKPMPDFSFVDSVIKRLAEEEKAEHAKTSGNTAIDETTEASKASIKTDANDSSKGSTKKPAAKGKKGKAATKDDKADKENNPSEAKTKKNSATKKKPETVDSSAIFEATPEAVTKRKPKKTAVVKGNNVEKNQQEKSSNTSKGANDVKSNLEGNKDKAEKVGEEKVTKINEASTPIAIIEEESSLLESIEQENESVDQAIEVDPLNDNSNSIQKSTDEVLPAIDNSKTNTPQLMVENTNEQTIDDQYINRETVEESVEIEESVVKDPYSFPLSSEQEDSEIVMAGSMVTESDHTESVVEPEKIRFVATEAEQSKSVEPKKTGKTLIQTCKYFEQYSHFNYFT
jgi:hypothetical protein